MSGRKQRSHFGEPDPEIEEAHGRLVAEGLLAPVVLGGSEEAAWTDCDLASLAENRIDARVDPRHLDDAQRADWTARATTERLYPPSAREYERCYWLLDRGQRVGTVALAISTLGGKLVRLSSFYLFATERGRGAGLRALLTIRDALGASDLGLRLETCWTWPMAVRFYLRAGMWVRMWKRDLDLWFDAKTLPPLIDVGDRDATLAVDVAGARVVLARARRDGARLLSFEDEVRAASGTASLGTDERVQHVAWDAGSTLALALALRGWPLLESPETWERGWHGDAGDPEGLADRIVLWEAWARKHRWRVDTPRIPGLPYPSWDELEAEWAKLEAELVKKAPSK